MLLLIFLFSKSRGTFGTDLVREEYKRMQYACTHART